MGTEEDLSAALDTIRTMSLAWAGEAGLPDAHVAAITTGSFVIHVGIGSASFAGRATAEVQDELWQYLVRRAPDDVVKISRLYVFDGTDFGDRDLARMLVEEQSA